MPSSGTLRFAFPSLTLATPLGVGRTMMTKRQKQVLDYLREYIDQHGYAPTLEEIGRHFRLASLATVHKHLRNLQRKRLIKRLPHQSRALEVVGPATASRAVTVPLLGRVAAGVPIEAVETAETITLPEEMLGRGETFALRVRGDSMVGEGILDGDLVVVESRPDAPNGAPVVAPAGDVEIRGVVIALLRRYR